MRRPCESLQRIDIRNVDFRLGTPWQYPRPNEIALSVAGDTVHVIHGVADFYITIDHTACSYGGSRPWFLCPSCGDRRAVLYSDGDGDGDGSFGCRRCMCLRYASEAEDKFDRLERKRRKLEAKLQPDGGKPKWMRVATFERIHFQRLRARADAAMWLVGKREVAISQ